MDHIVNIWVVGEDLVQALLVCDVDIVQSWANTRDHLNAIDDFIGRVVQVVHNDNLVASLNEGESGEGADVAGASGFSLLDEGIKQGIAV